MNRCDLNFLWLGKTALISCIALAMAMSLAICSWCNRAWATEDFCVDPNDVHWEDDFPPFDRDPYKTKPIEPYADVGSDDCSKLKSGKALTDLVPENTVSLTLRSALSRRMVNELTSLRNLRWLEITDDDGSDGLTAIHELYGLEYLYLGQHCNVSSTDLRAIGRLKKLKALQFYGRDDNLDLLNLRNCSQLRDLQAEWTNLSNTGLRTIAECQQLERLLLWHCSLSGDGLDSLSKLRQLRSLTIVDPRFTDGSAVHFEKLPGLCVLNLPSPSIGDAMLPGIAKIESLKVLLLPRTRVSDQGAELIKKLSGLTRLDLSDTNVTDAGVAKLTGLGHLEALYLNKTKLTTKALDYLLSLPNLSSVGIPDSLLHTPQLKKLAGLRKLRVLQIDQLYHPTDVAQQKLLSELKAQFPGVEVHSFAFGFSKPRQELEPAHDTKKTSE